MAQSRVISIEHDHPLPSDRVLIDSQILIWLCYARGQKPKSGVHTRYDGYVKAALQAGAQLWHCPLQLSEIAHIIEKQESEYFGASQGKPIKIKDFRRFTKEHDEVSKLVETAWAVTGQLAPYCAELVLTSSEADTACQRFREEMLDTYDIYIAEAMRQNEVDFILSADRDFVHSSGMTVLTADLEVIDIAKRENRLDNPRSYQQQVAAKRALPEPPPQ